VWGLCEARQQGGHLVDLAGAGTSSSQQQQKDGKEQSGHQPAGHQAACNMPTCQAGPHSSGACRAPVWHGLAQPSLHGRPADLCAVRLHQPQLLCSAPDNSAR